MNDNYLWDKTGEPDVEVQRLEEVLGTLRYQPQAFTVPASVQLATRRRFFPSWAIAAAIALMLLGAGLWIAFRRQKVAAPMQAHETKERVIDNQQPGATPNQLPAQSPENNREQTAHDQSPRRRRHNIMAGVSHTLVRDKSSSSRMSAADRDKAEAAKNQLLLALRVASAKLNLAQRRTQAPVPNNIRNQHKIG